MFYATLPSTPLIGLRREIDRLFDDSFSAGQAPAGWTPATDIRENDTALTIEMDLPGVSPELVEVTTDKDVLTIKGRREDNQVMGSEKVRSHVIERVHGAFQRSFKLPESVDASAIEATHSNGVLVVRLPKAPKVEPRKVQVVVK